MEARDLKERFSAKLGLTPEQSRTIEPMLEKMSEDLKAVRIETTRHISSIVKNAYEQIGKGLTAEQRQKLEEMQKGHHENWHRHFNGFRSESQRRSNSPPDRL